MKTIVFAPFNGGVAHIVRCLAMAEQLPEHRCIVIAQPERLAIITKGWKVPKHIELLPHTAATFYDDLEFLRKLWTGNGPRKVIYEELDFYYQAIHDIRPDLVVADGTGFALLAADELGIPAIQPGIAVLYPYQNAFLRLTRHDSIQRVVNSIGKHFANRFIQNVWNDVFSTYESRRKYKIAQGYGAFMDNMDKVLFDKPEYLTLKPNMPNLHCFPLPVSSLERGTKQEFDQLRARIGNKRCVYITLGGTGYAPKLIKRLVRAFLDAGYFVICSTAQILDPMELPNHDDLYTARFIPGYAATSLADVVVSHGSQGTTDHAARSRTPLLVIPFNLDHYMTLDTHRNPLVQNMTPLGLYGILRGMYDFKWLAHRPNEIDINKVIGAADALPKKNSTRKAYPKPDKKDTEIADYINANFTKTR